MKESHFRLIVVSEIHETKIENTHTDRANIKQLLVIDFWNLNKHILHLHIHFLKDLWSRTKHIYRK